MVVKFTLKAASKKKGLKGVVEKVLAIRRMKANNGDAHKQIRISENVHLFVWRIYKHVLALFNKYTTLKSEVVCASPEMQSR